MKFLLVVLAFGTLGQAGTHRLIIEFDGPVDVAALMAGLETRDIRRLGNEPVYRVVCDTSMTRDALIEYLYLNTPSLDIEENQRVSLVSLESAADLEARAIDILDVEPDFLDDEQVVELETRAMFVIESEEQALLPVYEQYHVYHCGAHLSWDYATGQGVTIAVIDTGVDVDHRLLRGNLVSGFDFVDGDSDPDEEQTHTDLDGDGRVDEGFGHGTHIAGILKTLAPNVQIMPIRAVDSNGDADLFDIVQGIRYAVDNGADIINLSMSIPQPSRLLEKTLDYARSQGRVVVTSAGNDNSNKLEFPATEPGVLTVTSIGPFLTKSGFANYSGRIDVAAPGEQIISAHPGDLYVSRSGTSMSSPMAAAQAALLRELAPDASVSFIQHRISHSARDINDFNPSYKNRLGSGLIDFVTALGGL